MTESVSTEAINKTTLLNLAKEANIQIPYLMSLLTEQKLIAFFWKKVATFLLVLCCVLGFYLIWLVFSDHSFQIKQESNVIE